MGVKMNGYIVHIRVHPEDYELLTNLAIKRETSLPTVIRDLMDLGLDKMGEKRLTYRRVGRPTKRRVYTFQLRKDHDDF